MTQPKNTPSKLFFLGLTNTETKSHHKRKYGWLPNPGIGRSKQRGKRKKK